MRIKTINSANLFITMHNYHYCLLYHHIRSHINSTKRYQLGNQYQLIWRNFSSKKRPLIRNVSNNPCFYQYIKVHWIPINCSRVTIIWVTCGPFSQVTYSKSAYLSISLGVELQDLHWCYTYSIICTVFCVLWIFVVDTILKFMRNFWNFCHE